MLAVGDANLDVWMRVPRHPDGRLGEELVTGVVGESCSLGAGGAAANVAAGVSRLGGNTAFVGSIGDDVAGQQFKDAMQSAGVNVSQLQVTPNQATSVAAMFETPNGEYTFYVCPGTRQITTHCLPRSFVQSFRMLYVTGHALTEDPVTCETMLETINLAHESQVVVAIDPGKFWLNPALESRVYEAVKQADIVLPNQAEANLLTGCDAPHDAARSLVDDGVDLAVVTMGERGCVLATKEETIERPAYLSDCSCTMGAGDAFASGLLYSYLAGQSPADMAIFANATAGIKIQKPGAQEGLPHATEVKEFLRNA